MLERDRLFLGGDWVEPASDGRIELVNPATEELIGSVPAGTSEDVGRGVSAARAAFLGWASTPPAQRAAVLRRIAAGLTARMDEVGALVTAQVGMPLARATLIQGGAPVLVASSYAEIAAGYQFETRDGPSLLVRQPVGVVGCLTPWNWPLYVTVCKVAAALAAGCTVVVKPSEVAPLTEFLLAEVMADAGLPPGVFNLVSGTGPVAGEALVVHPGIDKVSFTGSTATGRRVAELAGRALHPVVAELGGKSAAIVLDDAVLDDADLDDADLDEAVESTVRQAFLNSGQTCLAWSRLLVPRERLEQAARIAAKVADGLVVGDPTDPATDLGPLATSALRDRVRSLIRAGVDEGATLVCGGADPPPALDRGWYVRPTVFAAVAADMAIAREEVFGPVLVVMAHDGDDHAVEIANSSGYGLHGAVFSADRERALAVARRLRTGQVDIGGAGYNPRAPIGGFGLSGWGRELGEAGMEEFLALSSIQL